MQDRELLMILKTRQSLFSQVAQFVKENHPYEVPEAIATQVVAGLPPYMKWVLESTGPASS